MYILHVLLIPGLFAALIGAHLFIMFHQKHTQMPGKGRTNKNVVGAPMYPYFMAKTGAFFLFVFAACALASTFAQINPIWIYGPYNPLAISAGSQPDFYMGFLEGSLRIMPAWQWVIFGHTFAFNVFIPALLPLGLIMTGAALWPFIEQWITGDKREHHLNDRPRNAPTRTAVGMAAVAFYGVLWLEGANDLLAQHFDVALYTITEIARVAVFVVPILAYFITKRICLGLQRKDLHLLEHGVETGIIRQLPNGEFIEETRPLDEEELAKLALDQPERLALPVGASGGEDDVPPPGMRGEHRPGAGQAEPDRDRVRAHERRTGRTGTATGTAPTVTTRSRAATRPTRPSAQPATRPTRTPPAGTAPRTARHRVSYAATPPRRDALGRRAHGHEVAGRALSRSCLWTCLCGSQRLFRPCRGNRWRGSGCALRGQRLAAASEWRPAEASRALARAVDGLAPALLVRCQSVNAGWH